jgi:hypothetical protein
VIIRERGSSFLLITQPDHARLARQLVARMRTEPALETATRDDVLLACREHDNGWLEVDRTPTVDPSTGRPFDFMSGPIEVKHDLWPRGIVRAAAASPRAGALVAEHALTVYAYRRGEPAWQPFFDTVTMLRDDLLDRIDARNGEGRARFDLEYRCVRLGDSLSLQFCNGWTDAQDTLGYTSTLDGDRLMIAPDPFAGETVRFRVPARAVPARAYAGDRDLRAEVVAASTIMLEGEACGIRAGGSCHGR